MSAKMWFMNVWKVGSTLQKPKNIMVGLKSPIGVIKAASIGLPLKGICCCTPLYVELCEYGGILHVIDEFRDER